MNQNQSQPSSLALSLPLLRQSISSLASSLATLDACTADMPRLAHVLTSTRHFELLPAGTLAAAEARLVDEIQPEVVRLLEVAEGVVERRERRSEWLRARWELYEGRLGGRNEQQSSNRGSMTAKAQSTASSVDTLKAQRLRQKKDRLSYAVERLELQAQQKERQLRMSMAAQQVREGSDNVIKDDDDDDDDFRF